MNDAARVCRRQRIGDLHSYQKSAAQLQRPTSNQLPDVASFDVLHRDEMQPIGLVQIEDGTNIRMVQRGGEAGFAFKALEVGFFYRKLGGQNFDDNGAAQLVVGGL